MMIGMRSVTDEIQVPISNTKQVSRVSAIAAFVVDVQNQQFKIILHMRHYFKELITMKVAMELIMAVKSTQICRTWNGPVDQEDEHEALSTNLNFKRVVGCQVSWPLKLWFLVWHVLKTMTTKAVGFGKFVWPDICDIDLVERLRVVKILPKPQIKDGQDLVNLS